MAKFEKYQQGTPSYVELIAPDPAAGAAFYSALFGWEIEELPLPEEAGGGVYRQGKIDGDTVCGISGQMPGMEGHPAFWGVYLTVDDIDATTAKVEAAGGKVEAPPFDVMDVGRMSAIQDPTGARVNLWQPGTSIGTERANEPGTPVWNELVSPDIEQALAFYGAVVGMGARPRSRCRSTPSSPTPPVTSWAARCPRRWTASRRTGTSTSTSSTRTRRRPRSTSSVARRSRPTSTFLVWGVWVSTPIRRVGCSISSRLSRRLSLEEMEPSGPLVAKELCDAASYCPLGEESTHARDGLGLASRRFGLNLSQGPFHSARCAEAG
jgi:predicted enzyme related to lactoylglutathione lyase